jgi:hypothetical protein
MTPTNRCCNKLEVQKRQAVEARELIAMNEAILEVRTRAAIVVQQAWRSYCHRRTFEYYRDLIAFKEQCDPKQVLKHVNPVEANLIDAAAGANHCKPRLNDC